MTTTSMPIADRAIVNTADAPALSSDYAHFKMHGEYAAGATKISDDTGIFADLTPTNAPDWTATGWLTASDSAGGSGTQITSPTAAEKGLVRTDTLSGSLLVCAWIQIPDAISATDTIASYGRGNDNDSWTFDIRNTRKMFLTYGATVVASATAMAVGSRHHVGAIYDIANSQMMCYLDGAQDIATTAITPLSAVPTQDRIGILLSANGGAGVSEYGEGNTITSNDSLISDLMIIRFESDVSANFDTYIAGLYNTARGKIPEIMDGA